VKLAPKLGSLVATGRLATVHRGVLGGRAVAVKRARPEVAGAAAALRREARILGTISHPALVPVLDLVDHPEAPALVLGWADGGSLTDLVADGPVTGDVVLHLARPLAAALDALHRAGVAHLDVSPGNVLLAAAGPLLIDPAPPGAGTPGYTDPSVAAGAPPSARSDVYGLAGCAYLALTGRHPRAGGGLALGLALPPALAAALAAGLHPDPRQRPASPGRLVDQLERALLPASPHRRRPGSSRPAVPLADGRSVPAGRRGAGPSDPTGRRVEGPGSLEKRVAGSSGGPKGSPVDSPVGPVGGGARRRGAPSGSGPGLAKAAQRNERGAAEVLARPVVRDRESTSHPPRTWPFDRWQEEADAAVDRAAHATGPSQTPRRRRRILLAAVLVIAMLAAVTVASWSRLTPLTASVISRSSASDSTPRPPAARPPPTTTPGGSP